MSTDYDKTTIFLCHATDDKPIIRSLYKRMVKIGLRPWLDEENLLPGQDWHEEVRKAIDDSIVVLVCLSNRSISKTGYVQREIKYALDVAEEYPFGEVFIIPARLEPCSVPRPLEKYQWVNLYEEKGFDKLLTAIRQKFTQKYGASVPMLQFIEELYRAKGYEYLSPERHDEIVKELLQKVNDFVLAKSIAVLSDKDAFALEKLLDQNVSDEKIQEFFAEKIPNIDNFLASVFHEFRQIYLGTSR